MKKVNTEECKKLIGEVMDDGETMLILGFAGNGKSQMVNEMAKEKKLECIDERVSLRDVGDWVMKMPNKDRDAMVELVNQDFIRDKPTVYFFDEFLHAQKHMRNLCYQVFLDRKIGNYKLPEGSSVFAASNPNDEVESDSIERPLMDRFDHKVYLEFDLKRWEKWAYENGLRTEVISFIDMFGDKVINTNIDEIPLTPRTWHKISNKLDRGNYQSRLPHETGLMFKSFMDRINEFKNIEDYLDGKEKLKDELEIQFAFISALTNKISNNKSDKIVQKWFDGKVKGMREEVKVFGNISVLMRHSNLMTNGNAGRYWHLIDKSLQGKLMSAWKDLGYLTDDKV